MMPQPATGSLMIGPLSLHSNPKLTDSHFVNKPVECFASPPFVVITVVYNAAPLIEESILSVITQTYSNLQYIIVDGGSTDGTLDIIKKYSKYIDYWISEKDHGIYDAMNKALAIVNRAHCIFLGADDKLEKPTSIQSIFESTAFEYDVILCPVRKMPKSTYHTSRVPDLKSFRDFFLFPLHHQGFIFINKGLFFHPGLGIHADLDHMYRILLQSSGPIYVSSDVVSSIRLEGATARFLFPNFLSLLKVLYCHAGLSGIWRHSIVIPIYFFRAILRSILP
jgi:glycosyltransferase involved in cell wall biosynthesis